MTFKGEGQIRSPERDIPVEMSKILAQTDKALHILHEGQLALDGVMTVAQYSESLHLKRCDYAAPPAVQLSLNRPIFFILPVMQVQV